MKRKQHPVNTCIIHFRRGMHITVNPDGTCPACKRETQTQRYIAEQIKQGAAPGIATNQTIRELMGKA